MSETAAAAKLSFLQGYTKSNTLNSLHPSIYSCKKNTPTKVYKNCIALLQKCG
jgi:hypothetical protein